MTKLLLATAAMVLICLAPIALYASDIRVTVDGETVNFPIQAPVIVQDRTLVPVRGVFEHLGFEAQWHPAQRRAILTRHDHVIIITIGSNVFTTNGISHTLDVPAQIINDSTMLPLRHVLESIGYELDWNAAATTVIITRPLAGGRFVAEGAHGATLTFGDTTFSLEIDIATATELLGDFDMGIPTIAGSLTLNGQYTVNQNAGTINLSISRAEATRTANTILDILSDYTANLNLDQLSAQELEAVTQLMLMLAVRNVFVGTMVDQFMAGLNNFGFRFDRYFNRLVDDVHGIVLIRQ